MPRNCALRAAVLRRASGASKRQREKSGIAGTLSVSAKPSTAIVPLGCERLRRSDFQEKFAAVHPQQDEPITQQNDGAAEERFKPCAGQPKEIGTQVDAEGAV